jgi:hypothetical protein
MSMPTPPFDPNDRHAEYRRQAEQQFQAGPSSPLPPAGSADMGQPADAVAVKPTFNVQPDLALWAIAAISFVALMISPSIGWGLVGASCAVAGWYARRTRTAWPADLDEVLVKARLVPPTASPAPQTAPQTGVIPFRPMSLRELYGGALTAVLRHWPTLLGIPVALLSAAAAAGAAIGWIAAQVLISAATDDLGSLFALLAQVWMIALVVIYVVALPLDAALLGLSVSATDKAVRGEPVRMSSILSAARAQILPMGRLTLIFYAIAALPDVIFLMLLGGYLPLPLYIIGSLLFSAATFVLGILFSLSPIVLIIEKRGAIDSLKRSLALAKPALGRLIGIHLLWVVCAAPLFVIGFALDFGLVLWIVAAGALLAYFRTLQVLIYTDLRMRQEQYEAVLISEWARNTGASPAH